MEVKRELGLHRDMKVIQTSIDRPEIALCLNFIPRNKKSSAPALRFLLKDANRQDLAEDFRQRISKSVVFYDNKKTAYCDRNNIRSWAVMSPSLKYSQSQAKEAITVFNRDMAEDDKNRIIALFQMPNSPIRVLLATEAIGIGVDIPDIRRVVLNGLPMDLDPAIPWQRGGRAGRDGSHSEMDILLEK